MARISAITASGVFGDGDSIAEEGGVDRAGGYAVYADAVGGVVDGHGADKADDAVFGDGIGGNARLGGDALTEAMWTTLPWLKRSMGMTAREIR